ncbi:MAG: carboxymuconolactone decarboxylase family protein [Oscillatoriales cyanobacterium SM2_1_8]|nr:carboxymuconolactone decarboxylase family protein [Oscillatoriales cyanobacterium SM2_1_8]
MAYTNAVLDDAQLQAGLRGINPKFGDYCIRAAGEVWGLPLLSQKLKALITIVLDVVHQDQVGPGNPFGAHVNMALQQGANRDEIEEVLLFACAYAGFNKAAGAFGALNDLLGPSPYPADYRLDFSEAKLQESRLQEYVAEVGDSEYSHLFYRIAREVWGLPLLPTQDKAFLAIAIDIASQTQSSGEVDPFAVHVKIAANQGVTKEAIAELIQFCGVYAGFSKTVAFFVKLKALAAQGLI